MSSPKETLRERSLRITCDNVDIFAEKNLGIRQQSAKILSQILAKNTDKYNLTEEEKSDVIDYYENEDAPTTIYDRFLKKRMSKPAFCTMVAESNVRARDEVKAEKLAYSLQTPAEKQADALAVKNAKLASRAYIDRVMAEEQIKQQNNTDAAARKILGFGFGTKKRRGKKNKRRTRGNK